MSSWNTQKYNTNTTIQNITIQFHNKKRKRKITMNTKTAQQIIIKTILFAISRKKTTIKQITYLICRKVIFIKNEDGGVVK